MNRLFFASPFPGLTPSYGFPAANRFQLFTLLFSPVLLRLHCLCVLTALVAPEPLCPSPLASGSPVTRSTGPSRVRCPLVEVPPVCGALWWKSGLGAVPMYCLFPHCPPWFFCSRGHNATQYPAMSVRVLARGQGPRPLMLRPHGLTWSLRQE